MKVSSSLYINIMSVSHIQKTAVQGQLTSLIFNAQRQFLNIVSEDVAWLSHGRGELSPLADTSAPFDINREKTEICQEHTWLQQPKRAVGETSRLGGPGALPVQMREIFARGTAEVDCREK